MFLAADDVDRDGRTDLVVANYGAHDYYSATVASTVSVLLGNGDGTFQAPQPYEAGSGPHGIAIGDVNRDGILDLVVADLGPYPERATTVAVLLGQGNGTFGAPRFFEAGHALTGVALGDFNGDGVPDLALSSGDDASASVLIGNGDGTFQPMQSLSAGSSPKSVAVGDFNGDGYADLVVANHWSDTVSVFLGNGDGTFQIGREADTGRNPAWIAVADLNGDGMQDLAVANWFATSVSVLIGKGDGTFERNDDLGAASAPEKVVVADFNGDGQPDLAVANYFAASVSVLINRTLTPRVAAPTFTPPAGTYVGSVSVAISSATSGASIHYTTDGSAPTAASALYAGPIAVTRSTTIRAIAVLSGLADSAEGSATYMVQAHAPVFTPVPGTYDQPQSVRLTSATSGATIHYTTDGSTPTIASPVYSGPIAVTRSTTIRAMAEAPELANSAESAGAYTLRAAMQTFSPAGGAYVLPQFVELSSASPGTTIYYTTDGTMPTTASARYSDPIMVVRTTMIRAIAVAPGWSPSGVASATYVMLIP